MSCGKIPYGSKAGAKAAARRATSTHGGRAMVAFRCEACARWHVGHARRGTVVACRTCGRPLTLSEPVSGRSRALVPVDAAGRLHDYRLCSPEAAIA